MALSRSPFGGHVLGLAWAGISHTCRCLQRVSTSLYTQAMLHALHHAPDIPIQIVDMPLLFETGFYHFTSPRLLVAAGEGMQRRRLMARDGLSEEAADVRVSSQMPLSAKRRLADIVVENDGDVEELRQSARTVGGLLQRHRWLHIWFFSPLGLGLVAAALFSLR
uniref:Dephospho-CoA kinase n=1 Tax=Auxenochlorella protothecoides TaxID=3075 RepID=A0A1D2AB99_AUXPR